MRYAFIKRHQKAWPITLMCRVLEVSKTGYYDWGKRCPGVRAASNQALDEHIPKKKVGVCAQLGYILPHPPDW